METWHQFEGNPIIGVGPENFRLEYVNHDAIPVSAQFTHNEFLQVAADSGSWGTTADTG